MATLKDKLYQSAIQAYKTLSRYHTFNVRQVKVETTKVCNLHCPGCRRNYTASISSEPGPKHLTTGALWRILATTSMLLVRFEGDGEPTCNPHFRDLVKMCSDLGVRSAMTCNGTLLDEDYIKFLDAHGMRRIHISFDGVRKDTFEKLRLGADYEQVLHACKLVATSGIQLFMNVLLSSEEIIEQLPEYAHLAKEVGATGVHIMKYQAESSEGFQGPDLREHRNTIKAFEQEAKKLGLLYVSTVQDQPAFQDCEDAYTCPYVLLNDDVYACSYMANLRRTETYLGETLTVPYEQYQMGNLKEKWMKSIWYGDAYRELREELNSSRGALKSLSLSPERLLKYKQAQKRGRFAYCRFCSCRWGESGI